MFIMGEGRQARVYLACCLFELGISLFSIKRDALGYSLEVNLALWEIICIFATNYGTI